MKSIVRNREYLALHRRTIIGRSLAASIAGAIPVPVLDDWLVASIRRGTIRRIAETRGVDIDDEAVRAIADGPESPPQWSDLVGGGLAFRLLSRQWKKLLFAVLAAKRAQAAARNFEVATLFDHYCAREHVGMGLTGGSAKAVRALIDQARHETNGGLSRQLFRRGLVFAAKGSARAPMNIADLLTGGRIGKLLTGASEEVEATTEVDEALETQLDSDSSFLARSAAAIELELAVDRNPYLDNLLDHFGELSAAAREQDEDEDEH
ncbi:MAG: hypothetical protein GY811_12135 [Myxococcales bacterium]|nr:hypothetical protein [Myxococcales bacterium]